MNAANNCRAMHPSVSPTRVSPGCLEPWTRQPISSTPAAPSHRFSRLLLTRAPRLGARWRRRRRRNRGEKAGILLSPPTPSPPTHAHLCLFLPCRRRQHHAAWTGARQRRPPLPPLTMPRRLPSDAPYACHEQPMMWVWKSVDCVWMDGSRRLPSAAPCVCHEQPMMWVCESVDCVWMDGSRRLPSAAPYAYHEQPGGCGGSVDCGGWAGPHWSRKWL